MLRSVILFVPLLFAPLAADSQPYADGVAAFERGDYAMAIEAWRPLASAGDPRAQLGLGLIYQLEQPEGLADVEEALHWLRRAARQGLPAAKNNLAILYAEGRGVAQDPALALSNWREAASAGYAPAMLNLARALERGFGTPSDPAEAAQWYQRAADQGVHDSVSPVPAELDSPPAADPLPEPRVESGIHVQLASFPTADAAAAATREIELAHREALAGLQPTVRRVDLGADGVWFRVLVGPFEKAPSARAFCEALRARSAEADCLVVSD